MNSFPVYLNFPSMFLAYQLCKTYVNVTFKKQRQQEVKERQKGMWWIYVKTTERHHYWILIIFGNMAFYENAEVIDILTKCP